MELNEFRHQFKKLNGVYADKDVILTRRPLELIDMSNGGVIAKFGSLDDVLRYELNGQTIEDRIREWDAIVFPCEHGNRGSDSGNDAFSGGWDGAGGDEADDDTRYDHPARMNVKLSVNRTYEDMLRAFEDTHAASAFEHGVVVDAQGFAVKYRHGGATSVSGLSGTNSEIALHNHPSGGWPNFSKEDVLNTAMGTRKGIVAVSSTKGRGDDTAKYAGTYSFIKGHKFDANGFIKAVGSAQLRGKDYNDAVSKWLRANQKKYGYKFSFSKARS